MAAVVGTGTWRWYLALVKAVDVAGRVDDELFGLAFAEYFPAPAISRFLRLAVGAAHRFQNSQASQTVGVPPGRQ